MTPLQVAFNASAAVFCGLVAVLIDRDDPIRFALAALNAIFAAANAGVAVYGVLTL